MKKKQIETKHTCNMCHHEMPYSAEVMTNRGELILIPVCTNPRCPNYAVLQISAEQMPKNDIK